MTARRSLPEFEKNVPWPFQIAAPFAPSAFVRSPRRSRLALLERARRPPGRRAAGHAPGRRACAGPRGCTPRALAPRRLATTPRTAQPDDQQQRAARSLPLFPHTRGNTTPTATRARAPRVCSLVARPPLLPSLVRSRARSSSRVRSRRARESSGGGVVSCVRRSSSRHGGPRRRAVVPSSSLASSSSFALVAR